MSRNIFLLGIILFIISYLLPIDLFEKYTNLRPTGFTSMFVCPVLGFLGIIFRIRNRNKLYIVLNLLLMLLLPLAIFITHFTGE
ncbi:MAG: hypothetical protein Q4B52_08045 [Tissierellia bacterium]|nr:hypothetical protein [Tissierellia bacterium]